MENETKKCKHCQTEIPKKAKVCPNCKKKQGGILKWVVISLIILAFIGSVTEESDNSENSVTTTVNNDKNNDVNNQSDEIQKTTEKVKETTTKESTAPETTTKKEVETTTKAEETTTNKVDEESKEAETTTKKSENGEITVGSSFKKDKLKITVNEASTDFRDYENEYGWNTPKDGMKYIMVSFTFENNGKSDEYVSIYDFNCYADNTKCEQVFTLDDGEFINTNLSSGRNVSFKTYYEVPVSSQSIELEYEINMWTGKKAVIKIQ